eukprot:scaffold129674_cov66-Phaeocystis_antarctica.AAC.13
MTCVGKETYLSASYWLTLETMLETEEKANLYSGASCSVDAWPYCRRLASTPAYLRVGRWRNRRLRRPSLPLGPGQLGGSSRVRSAAQEARAVSCGTAKTARSVSRRGARDEEREESVCEDEELGGAEELARAVRPRHDALLHQTPHQVAHLDAQRAGCEPRGVSGKGVRPGVGAVFGLLLLPRFVSSARTLGDAGEHEA